jgi:FtsP/CotA-like multicopper oxidase with cupredoxin domain
MSSIRNIGTVTNGTTDLATVAFDKFTVIISAEKSADVADRAGKLVLRGSSPSTRLQPPDVLEFALGALTRSDASAAGHVAHAAVSSNRAEDSAQWTTVPMPPRLTMLPAEMELRPRVAAWLPARRAAALPRARPAELTRLRDGDTLRLTASQIRRTIHGREYTMYAYNGQVPGPLLWVSRGAMVTVQFTNQIDQPTTIHWHGLRLDHRFDGVPHVSQAPIAPGDSFTYEVRFPDSGLYWYHSHVREDVQQDLGLAANIMVRGDSVLPPVHREEVVMLDDILLGDTGLIPYGSESATHALMGRFGNILLANGQPRWNMNARPGEVVRLWFTNVANTRAFNLSVPGARMKLVASDMSPFSEQDWVESVVISPAERYAVDLRFDSAGTAALVNRVRAIDHLYGDFLVEVDTIGVVTVSGARLEDAVSSGHADLVRHTGVADEIHAAVASAPPRSSHTLLLGLETRDLPFFTERMMALDSSYFHPAEWSGTMPMMNWATSGEQARWFIRDAQTGASNDSLRLTFRRGERARLTLVNLRNSIHAMQHPIHVHGQRFLVLSVNGVAPRSRAWKDTVLLPAGAAIDILVEFDNPGRWMLHCHIAEHVSSGMMTVFEVVDS